MIDNNGLELDILLMLYEGISYDSTDQYSINMKDKEDITVRFIDKDVTINLNNLHLFQAKEVKRSQVYKLTLKPEFSEFNDRKMMKNEVYQLLFGYSIPKITKWFIMLLSFIPESELDSCVNKLPNKLKKEIEEIVK